MEMRTPASVSVVIQADPGELRSLIRIHDLGRAVSGDGFVQRFDAEVGVHRVAEAPAQDLARGPVHDCHEIQEAVPNRHKSDVGAPDLIGPVDLHLPQQIREDRVLWMRLAGSGTFIDCLKTHLRHQTTHSMAPHDNPFTAQIGGDLA